MDELLWCAFHVSISLPLSWANPWEPTRTPSPALRLHGCALAGIWFLIAALSSYLLSSKLSLLARQMECGNDCVVTLFCSFASSHLQWWNCASSNFRNAAFVAEGMAETWQVPITSPIFMIFRADLKMPKVFNL